MIKTEVSPDDFMAVWESETGMYFFKKNGPVRIKKSEPDMVWPLIGLCVTVKPGKQVVHTKIGKQNCHKSDNRNPGQFFAMPPSHQS